MFVLPQNESMDPQKLTKPPWTHTQRMAMDQQVSSWALLDSSGHKRV